MLAAALFSLVVSSCGGSGARSASLRFEAIQTHEATLERAISRAESLRSSIERDGPSDEDCAAVTSSNDEARRAAEDLCGEARGDADASVRCERARRRALDAAATPSACAAF